MANGKATGAQQTDLIAREKRHEAAKCAIKQHKNLR
jgi:hypothetical protein